MVRNLHRKTMVRRYREGSPVDGILLFDKPAGITSNAALQTVKRLFDAEKAGHTGILDPFATGLLPICFGQATKLGSYLLESDKRYRAVVRLGACTDTGDLDGTVVATSDVSLVTETMVADALPAFIGPIDQVPPMYSAIKQAGRHLYQLAREGVEVSRESRRVDIHSLELLEFHGDGFSFEVSCSKGTYVRTLAADWAARIGQCGHLTALRRLQTGPFTAEGMVTANQLLEHGSDLAKLKARLLPLADALPQWRKLVVGSTDLPRLRAGLDVGPYRREPAGSVLVTDEAGVAQCLALVSAEGRVGSKRWIGPEPAAQQSAV